MTIIVDRPPNFADIVKVFPQAIRPGIVFAFNGSIYNPSHSVIPRHILKHEAVHLARQGRGEEASLVWWERYLVDKEFRYNEELLAHKAEYEALIDSASNRAMRRGALKEVAGRLSAKLYGPMCTQSRAEKDIINGSVTLS